jgi:hypothetical protein
MHDTFFLMMVLCYLYDFIRWANRLWKIVLETGMWNVCKSVILHWFRDKYWKQNRSSLYIENRLLTFFQNGTSTFF